MTRTSLIALALACACVHRNDPEPTEPATPPEPAAAVVNDDDNDDVNDDDNDDDDNPLEFEAATRGEEGCLVTVSALLEAEEYRGPGPSSPALEATLAADPDFARAYQSEGHGDHHIQCHYQIEFDHMPGQRFRWREYRSNTLRDQTVTLCKGLTAEIAERVIEITKHCTDLDAGAYWGFVLEPMV